MKKIKSLSGVILLIFIFSLLGCQSSETMKIAAPSVTGNFSITILKAGQADAILMQTQNSSIIIDCGETDDGDEIVKLLKEKEISNIDYFFITHFDKDHVGGFKEVMDNVTATNIYVPDYEGTNDEYREYLKTVEDNDLEITKADKDFSFVSDDVLFEVSVPKSKFYEEGDNDYSLVVSVTHGENTFLFTGDSEKERLPEVLSEFGKEYDFLKVPHHGKENKNSKRFINTIKPRYAVICDSEKNPASDNIISLLKSQGTEIYSTKNGDVFVESDGKEIKIKQ